MSFNDVTLFEHSFNFMQHYLNVHLITRSKNDSFNDLALTQSDGHQPQGCINNMAKSDFFGELYIPVF